MGEYKEAKTTIANMCPVCVRCGHTNSRRLDGNQQRARIVERTSKGCDIEGAKQK